MGYRRGLSRKSRLSVLRDHLSQNLKAAMTRRMPTQSPILFTNRPASTTTTTHATLPTSDPTALSLPPASSTKSLIPNWSYEKSSTAAAIIFSTIAVTALLFLVFLSAKKIRRSWERRRAERRTQSREGEDGVAGGKTECGSGRETAMFNSGRPSESQSYIVEQRGGSVSRVYREGRRSPHRTFNSMSCLPAQPKRAAASPARQKGGSAKPVPARKTQGSPGPRQVVVTQPPMSHAVSMRASPGRRVASESEKAGRDVVGSKSSVNLPSSQRSTSPIVES